MTGQGFGILFLVFIVLSITGLALIEWDCSRGEKKLDCDCPDVQEVEQSMSVYLDTSYAYYCPRHGRVG